MTKLFERQQPEAGEAAVAAGGLRSARGQWVVLALVLLGLAAAAVAWVWNYTRSRRALAFWGPETALLLRRAPTIELLLLERPLSSGEAAADAAGQIVLAGQRWKVRDRIDLSRTPGILNARTSLLQDASFLDQTPQAYRGPLPRVLLRFAEGSAEAWVGFDLEAGLAIVPTRGLALHLAPKTAAGWRDFLRRQQAQAGPQHQRLSSRPAATRANPLAPRNAPPDRPQSG